MLRSRHMAKDWRRPHPIRFYFSDNLPKVPVHDSAPDDENPLDQFDGEGDQNYYDLEGRPIDDIKYVNAVVSTLMVAIDPFIHKLHVTD